MLIRLIVDRRQALLLAFASAAFVRSNLFAHAQGGNLCARYVNGIIHVCDDTREPGFGETPGSSTSPTPWHTWNDDALRQWDADLQRWQGVRAETAARVSALVASLREGDMDEEIVFPELEKKLDTVLRELANNYVPAPSPSSANVAAFWKAIGEAKDGAEKILAVNKSLLGASASDKNYEHLSQFINSNGLIKGSAFQDVVELTPTSNDNLRGATLVANTNFILLADSALRDLKASGAIPDEPYRTALEVNQANLVSSLLLTSSSATYPVSLSQLEASSVASSPISNFLRGVGGGFTGAANEAIVAFAAIVAHPVDSGRAIAKALFDVPALAEAIGATLASAWETLRQGTSQERGELFGRLSFEIATAIAGGALANRIVASAQLSNKIRFLTDQFALRGYAKKIQSSTSLVPEGLKFISNYTSEGFETLWKYQRETDAVIDYLRAAEGQFDELMQVQFLPDGTLSNAGQLLKDSWNDIIKDTHELITETGLVIGLSNAKELVDRAWVLREEGIVPHSAAHYADRRYAETFELAVRQRFGGIEGTPENFRGYQVDVVTDDYLIQASVNDFRRSPAAVNSFVTGKRNQVEMTRTLADESGLKAAYYFRRKPPPEIDEFLRSMGMDDVWWDLE
ncbi:restriction endonuclease fold toxin [Paracoccus sp. WLY502]|uniref:restriction endonuclease fold toxin n=1 Tax=Paracoccus yibinensis TaxID=3068891 RepID=UPI00279699EA|nr:restriction endonuclease fold toxin [Paracoccus sp. WLY502]MDQ1902373.1 restriction endonuclease fold toxin [Paracoccus sp. WLY502]